MRPIDPAEELTGYPADLPLTFSEITQILTEQVQRLDEMVQILDQIVQNFEERQVASFQLEDLDISNPQDNPGTASSQS